MHHKGNSSLAFTFLPLRLVGLTLIQVMYNVNINIFLHMYFCSF